MLLEVVSFKVKDQTRLCDFRFNKTTTVLCDVLSRHIIRKFTGGGNVVKWIVSDLTEAFPKYKSHSKYHQDLIHVDCQFGS